MTCSCHCLPLPPGLDGTLPPQSRSTFAPGAGPGQQEPETLPTHPWSKVKAPLVSPARGARSLSAFPDLPLKDEPCSRISRPASRLLPLLVAEQPPAEEGLAPLGAAIQSRFPATQLRSFN